LQSDTFAFMLERKTQIMIAELLAPVVAIQKFPDFFRDSDFLSFVDILNHQGFLLVARDFNVWKILVELI